MDPDHRQPRVAKAGHASHALGMAIFTATVESGDEWACPQFTGERKLQMLNPAPMSPSRCWHVVASGIAGEHAGAIFAAHVILLEGRREWVRIGGSPEY